MGTVMMNILGGLGMKTVDNREIFQIATEAARYNLSDDIATGFVETTIECCILCNGIYLWCG